MQEEGQSRPEHDPDDNPDPDLRYRVPEHVGQLELFFKHFSPNPLLCVLLRPILQYQQTRPLLGR